MRRLVWVVALLGAGCESYDVRLAPPVEGPGGEILGVRNGGRLTAYAFDLSTPSFEPPLTFEGPTTLEAWVYPTLPATRWLRPGPLTLAADDDPYGVRLPAPRAVFRAEVDRETGQGEIARPWLLAQAELLAEARLVDPYAECLERGGCPGSLGCKLPCDHEGPVPPAPPTPPTRAEAPAAPPCLPGLGPTEAPGLGVSFCPRSSGSLFASCAPGQRRGFGTSCRPAVDCAAQPWPALPIGGGVLYVSPGARGVGTLEDPAGDLAAVMADAPDGAVVALAPGQHTLPSSITRSVELHGACEATTRLSPRFDSATATGPRVVLTGVELTGNLDVGFGAKVEIARSSVSAGGQGSWSVRGTLRLEDVNLHLINHPLHVESGAAFEAVRSEIVHRGSGLQLYGVAAGEEVAWLKARRLEPVERTMVVHPSAHLALARSLLFEQELEVLGGLSLEGSVAHATVLHVGGALAIAGSHLAGAKIEALRSEVQITDSWITSTGSEALATDRSEVTLERLTTWRTAAEPLIRVLAGRLRASDLRVEEAVAGDRGLEVSGAAIELARVELPGGLAVGAGSHGTIADLSLGPAGVLSFVAANVAAERVLAAGNPIAVAGGTVRLADVLGGGTSTVAISIADATVALERIELRDLGAGAIELTGARDAHLADVRVVGFGSSRASPALRSEAALTGERVVIEGGAAPAIVASGPATELGHLRVSDVGCPTCGAAIRLGVGTAAIRFARFTIEDVDGAAFELVSVPDGSIGPGLVQAADAAALLRRVEPVAFFDRLEGLAVREVDALVEQTSD